ncbi:MAG TPA: hypothetical protein VFW96_02630 [Thermomicrobiales bacterium]|nr:hypothetical protein [Thermomicrobiales bacterium]
MGAGRAGRSGRRPLGVVAQYELGLARYPTLEHWWRLTAALGVALPAFVRHAEERTGATLLGDVLDPQEPFGPAPTDGRRIPAGRGRRPAATAGGAASV